MPWSEIEQGAYYSDCKVKKETLQTTWPEEAEGLWKWSDNAVKEFE